MSAMMLSNMIRHPLADDSARISNTSNGLANSIPCESISGPTFTTPAPNHETYIRDLPVPRSRSRGAYISTSRRPLYKKGKPTNLVFDNPEDFERWANTRGKHNHRVNEEQEKWLWAVTGADAIGKTDWERCSQEFFKLFDEKWNGSRLMMEWYRMDRKMKTIAGSQPGVIMTEGVSGKETDTGPAKEHGKRKAAVAQITAPSTSRKRTSRGQRVNYAEDRNCAPDDLFSATDHDVAAGEEHEEYTRPNSCHTAGSNEFVLDSITLMNTLLNSEPCAISTQTGFTSINKPQISSYYDILDIQTTGHVQGKAQEIPSTVTLIPSTLDSFACPISLLTEPPATQDNLTNEGNCSIQWVAEIANGLRMEDQGWMKEIEAPDPEMLSTTRVIRRSTRLSLALKPPSVLNFETTAVSKNIAVADHCIEGDSPNPPAAPAAKPSLITAQEKFMRIYTYSASMGQRRPDADITFGPSVPSHIPSKPTTMTEGLVEILQALEFSPIRRNAIIFTDCAEAVREITAATFRAQGCRDTDPSEGENGELLGKILGALREREEARSTTRFEWIEGLRGKAVQADAKL